ncbi:MAG TPA: hypothetical protein VL282_06375, partial [Tepidisphaeraceae bacterium]|nr:hypothetical protein [Tepidisphaeraceae bacterium]
KEQLPAVPVRDWPKELNDNGEPISTLLRMSEEPPAQDDYPRWSDLLFACVEHVELLNALNSPVPFYSPRYSRVGETFCYLKFDQQDRKALVEFRAKLEDPLSLELQRSGLGSHIGGGTGQMYAYIFLALSDVTRAIEVIRQTLRAHLAPKRSWLLFYDVDLVAEWIGIWDDTPQPPV